MMTDAVTAVRTLEGKYKFDIVFMDPPYNKELEKEVLITLSDSDILKDDTLIVVEASNDTDFGYLTELGYEIVKEKIYKTNCMTLKRVSFVLSVVGLVSFPSIVFRGRLLAVPAIILILFSLL